MRTTYTLVLCLVCLCGRLSAQDKDSTPIHSITTVPSTARFEIIQSTLAARWMFKLDRQTGFVYQIVHTKDDALAWEKMEAQDLPVPAIAGVHYELFLSGLAARLMFLMNLDTGKTWQLQSSTDPITKEETHSWIAIH